MINGTVYYGYTDGQLYSRTFDGTTFGPATPVNGMDLLTPLTDFHNDVPNITAHVLQRWSAVLHAQRRQPPLLPLLHSGEQRGRGREVHRQQRHHGHELRAGVRHVRRGGQALPRHLQRQPAAVGLRQRRAVAGPARSCRAPAWTAPTGPAGRCSCTPQRTAAGPTSRRRLGCRSTARTSSAR